MSLYFEDSREGQYFVFGIDRFRFMLFNATFNNNSVIFWQSVLLVEEAGVPRENHQPVARY